MQQINKIIKNRSIITNIISMILIFILEFFINGIKKHMLIH